MTTLRRSFLSLWALCLAITLIPSHAEVIHEFVTIDYEWPNSTARAQSLANGDYAPKTGVVSGIQVYKGSYHYLSFFGEHDVPYTTIFVTVPRTQAVKGIPSGLNTVVKDANGKSVLRPYPNWAAQKIGDCSALQLPMSMAIDPNTGYLYVIDIGRVGISSPNPANLCPAKLVVYDTVGGGSTILSYEFPDSVVSRTTNYLNDIVIDYVNPEGTGGVKYAYMTDTLTRSLVVYDFAHNKSWAYKDPVSMGTDDDVDITIHGIRYRMDVGINGIAMSPTFNYLYYSSVGSKKLYQVPTWVLRTPGNDFVSNTRLVGSKKSQGGGMVFGHKGLFFGALEYDAVYRWDIEADIKSQRVLEGEVVMKTQVPVAQNWQTMQWTDALSLDNESNLYFTTNRLQKFVTNKMDFDGGEGANFRIFKYNVHDKSYLSPPSPFDGPEVVIG
ncbi:major royal jelly protein 1 [Aplysia californica]|uniref:Major royal jelly protein 1 n=1 Tax=Aplysia californica TaxID=6500 RepID=A0ABM0K1G4_APLCA|nr:major royal jelly protein 1 [Aplysia californica]